MRAANNLDFEVLAISGGPSLLSIKKGISINDSGWAAFAGERMGRSGRPVENVFSIHPETKQIKPLMNPVFEHRVIYPPLALSDGPTQSFGEFVQISNENQVLAWRNLNATVALFTWAIIPVFGQPMSAPMTYWETWPANGNEGVSGKIGLPSRTVYLGWPAKPVEFKTFWTNSSQLATWPVFSEIGLPNPPNLVNPFGLANYFINPAWGGEYPSKWFKADFAAVMRNGAINNKGQVVFTVLKNGGQKAEAVVSGGNVMDTPGVSVLPAIADNGNWVVRGTEIKNLYLLNNQMTSVTQIVGAQQGFSVVSMGHPNISDDGRFIVFYGDLVNKETALAMDTTTGPGIFVYFTDTKKISRVAGVSKTVTNVGGKITVGGLISSIATGVRPCVNNYGTCVFGGWSLQDQMTIFSSTLVDQNGKRRFDDPTAVVSVGDKIPGVPGAISDISIHDSLNNTSPSGEVLFLAQTQNRSAIVKAPIKQLKKIRFVDAAPIYFGIEPSMPYEVVWKIDPKIPNDMGHGKVELRKDSFQQWSQARKIGLIENAEVRKKISADGLAQVLCRVEVPAQGKAKFSSSLKNSAGKSFGYFYPIDSAKGQLPIAAELDIDTKEIEINGNKRHFAFAFFKPDEFAMVGQGPDIKLSIVLSFTPTGSSVETKYSSDLRITRPPVLLMHGIFASPRNFVNREPNCNFSEKTEEGLFRSIEKTVGADNIILGSYESSNSREFDYNVGVVQSNIENAIAKYRSEGGAIAKLDFVGHSMGGILGRMNASDNSSPGQYLYSYGNNSNIRKLITVGTPHLGAGTADLRVRQISVDPYFVVAQDWFNRKLGMPSDDGGVGDLTSGSDAIRSIMETQPDVRCHAIASDANPNDVYVWDNVLNYLLCFQNEKTIAEQVFAAMSMAYGPSRWAAAIRTAGDIGSFAIDTAAWGIRSCGNISSLAVPLDSRLRDAKLLGGSIPCTDLTSPESLIQSIFLGQGNDRVVSVPSQVGGIVGGQKCYTLIDNGPNHTDEAGDWRIGARVSELLDSSDENSWGRFPAPRSEKDPCASNGIPPNSAMLVQTPDLLDELKAKNRSTINRLEIIDVEGPGKRLIVECSLSGTNGAFVQVAFDSRTQEEYPSLHSITSKIPIDITLPDRVEGKCVVMLKEILNGRIQVTRKEIIVGTSAKFLGFSVAKRDVVIKSLGRPEALGIEGKYSDGIQRGGVDVLRGAVVTVVGQGHVEIGDDGFMRGVRKGVCEVKLVRDGMRASMFVTVDATPPKVFLANVDSTRSSTNIILVRMIGQDLNGIINVAAMTNGMPYSGFRFVRAESNASGTEADAYFEAEASSHWKDVELFAMNAAGTDEYEDRRGVPVSVGVGSVSIKVVNDLDETHLIWPGLESGQTLEVSPDLSDKNQWKRCDEVLLVGNGYGKYFVKPLEGQRFFRVRKIK